MMVRLTRQCDMCSKDITGREQGHVMKGKYVYYENYALDTGFPTRRRNFMFCPSCTSATAELWGVLHAESKDKDE